jgi:hypothetical protein
LFGSLLATKSDALERTLMTHAIPLGTSNLSLNLLSEERAILGRLAFQSDESIGGFIRRRLIAALELDHPAEATALREARRQRRAAVLLVCGMIAVGASFLPESKLDLRRPSAGRSIARVVRGNRMEAA